MATHPRSPVRRVPRCPDASPAWLAAAQQRYQTGQNPAALSYGTVEDYCDSFDHLRVLSGRALDLKDQQRPWVFKTLLGLLPPRANVLEIGAGEPLVADLLSSLGHRVTVVDPYDFPDPHVRYWKVRLRYPHLRILKEHFSRKTLASESAAFDLIYSTSVLEHIPFSALEGIAEGTRRLLKPGGAVVHAIDHVVRGHLAEWSREQVSRILTAHAADASHIEALETQALADTETFFLSGAGHNLWRGNTPYTQYRMQKVISLQVVLRGEASGTPDRAA